MDTQAQIAVLFLHPVCNMTCSFCITEDNFSAISSSRAEELLINLKQEGFENIVLGGGEPFVWPGDLIALTRKAKELGFFVQVGTNAAALPADFEFIPTIDRYVLPLESVDPEVHNRMRFYKHRHHQTILGHLEKLKTARKSATISTIVTKVNYGGLMELVAFLNRLNGPEKFIHAWHLYMFLPQGRGGSVNAPALSITEDEYERVVREVKMLKLPFPVYKRKNMYCSRTVDFFWAQDGQIVRASRLPLPVFLRTTT
jgi:MoaA/NifB/PqqE/SkfB family radical SAM enzyme